MTPDSERRNATAMYNPMLISEVKEMYPRFDWENYFAALFLETDVTIFGVFIFLNLYIYSFYPYYDY